MGASLFRLELKVCLTASERSNSNFYVSTQVDRLKVEDLRLSLFLAFEMAEQAAVND